jgi:hypothetical protein
MKTRIESDGKNHKITLISENVFEQSVIDAISCFSQKVTFHKENSSLEFNKIDSLSCDCLVLEIKDGN